MKDSFYILNGVRRALASLEAGRKTIPAIVYREGRDPELRLRMPLKRLFSPKAVLETDARFFRILPPIQTPIEVEPLGDPDQLPSVPLAKVKLV